MVTPFDSLSIWPNNDDTGMSFDGKHAVVAFWVCHYATELKDAGSIPGRSACFDDGRRKPERQWGETLAHVTDLRVVEINPVPSSLATTTSKQQTITVITDSQQACRHYLPGEYLCMRSHFLKTQNSTNHSHCFDAWSCLLPRELGLSRRLSVHFTSSIPNEG